MRHVVGLSGGKDSTALALALRLLEPRDYEYICTPTGDELPVMAAWWDRLESILEKPLIRITNPKAGDLNNLIQIMGALPNHRQRWGIKEVWGFLEGCGLADCIPERTDCARCYAQRLAEWYRLWKDNPFEYWHAVAQEMHTGHTFRSPSRDTWPASLADLAREFESGRKIRGGVESSKACRVCSL